MAHHEIETGSGEQTPLVPRRDRPRARALIVALMVLVAGVLWLRFRPLGNSFELAGATMGTSYTVTVDEGLSAARQREVQAVVEEALDRVDRLMSTYDSDSELSRLNRHASTEPVRVSRELMDVLTLARDVSERSEGAFDVTVAPLVEAWGFGPGGGIEGRLGPRPDSAMLARLRERVGYDKIMLDRSSETVAKAHPETAVDLSAIAKGYAAELVAGRLSDLGLTRFLVEVGGELKAVGTTREGRPWRVGIERPDDGEPGLWGVVGLADESIATSGDYRNYFEEDGVRYAHIIDPRSGTPLRMRGASVSVIHVNAAVADAWATALTVLGPDEGYALARRENLAVLYVEPVPGGFQSLVTPAIGDRFQAANPGR